MEKLLNADRRFETIIAAAALATRLGHWLGFLLGKLSDFYYQPVLASLSFETGALGILHGQPSSSPFMFGGPVYAYLIVPVYALGLGRLPLLVLQTAIGLLIPLSIYRLSRRLGSSAVASLVCSMVWCFYGPAMFLELTILPETLAALTTLALVAISMGSPRQPVAALAGGLMGGFLGGVRAPLAAAILPLLGRIATDKGRSRVRKLALLLGTLAAFAIPLIPLAVHQEACGAGFYPSARVGGLNLALGHGDGVTGYGPPAPSLGLQENPGEDISSVSLRVAAERGADGPIAADRYWRNVALAWIVEHPRAEAELVLRKLGGFFGLRAIDVYYDLGRLDRFNPVFRFMPVPRGLLVGLFCIGLLPFALKGRHRASALIPIVAALLTSLVFFHTERFSLPAEPLMLVVAAAGITAILGSWKQGSRARASAWGLSGLILMIPAILRPVPAIPEGIYLESMGARAYNLGEYELALEIYERAAVVAPEGTATWVESHSMAAFIARNLGMTEKACLHSEILTRFFHGPAPGGGVNSQPQ
jgi:hypothetical protein